MTFRKPSNWCDRRCTRCPLVDVCEEGLQTSRRRWALETRGGDPDSPENRLHDRERAASEIPAREKSDAPVNLLVRRVEERAMRYTDAVSGVLNQLPDEVLESDPEVLHIIDNAILIGGKVGRLTATLGADGEPGSTKFWQADSVPNLLLLEALERETFELLRRLSSVSGFDDFERARADLRVLLKPYFERIPESARVELAEMCAEEVAPSPFVTTDSVYTDEDLGTDVVDDSEE